MDYTIREVEPIEFLESARIIREAFLTVAAEFNFTKENNPTNGAFIHEDRLLEEYNKGIQMFGLFEDSKQAGFMAIEKKDTETYYLEKLAVTPAFRHRGYGSSLMDYARDFVSRAGGHRISIAIINENARLKRWYEQYGFVQTGLKQFDHLSFTVCFMEIKITDYCSH